jgi:hypothetical protein
MIKFYKHFFWGPSGKIARGELLYTFFHFCIRSCCLPLIKVVKYIFILVEIVQSSSIFSLIPLLSSKFHYKNVEDSKSVVFPKTLPYWTYQNNLLSNTVISWQGFFPLKLLHVWYSFFVQISNQILLFPDPNARPTFAQLISILVSIL